MEYLLLSVCCHWIDGVLTLKRFIISSLNDKMIIRSCFSRAHLLFESLTVRRKPVHGACCYVFFYCRNSVYLCTILRMKWKKKKSRCFFFVCFCLVNFARRHFSRHVVELECEPLLNVQFACGDARVWQVLSISSEIHLMAASLLLRLVLMLPRWCGSLRDRSRSGHEFVRESTVCILSSSRSNIQFATAVLTVAWNLRFNEELKYKWPWPLKIYGELWFLEIIRDVCCTICFFCHVRTRLCEVVWCRTRRLSRLESFTKRHRFFLITLIL